MNALLTTARILTLIVAIFGAFCSLVLCGILHAEVRRADNSTSYYGQMPSEERQEHLRAIPFLLVGAPLAVIGGVLAVNRRLGNATVWLLVTGLGPILLSKGALCPSIVLFGAAFLSLVGFLIDVMSPLRVRPADAFPGGRHA